MTIGSLNLFTFKLEPFVVVDISDLQINIHVLKV